jgi:hypothetical protein
MSGQLLLKMCRITAAHAVLQTRLHVGVELPAVAQAGFQQLPVLPCNLCPITCFLQVEVELSEPEPGNTVLQLKHTGLPEADKYGHGDVQEQVEQGWKGQIFNRIRAVFGYGV